MWRQSYRPLSRRAPFACDRLERRTLLSGTLTVNSSADDTASDGALTLREAILYADGRLGRALSAQEAGRVAIGTGVGPGSADDIVFDNGVGTVAPTSPLPYVGAGDNVDGRKPDGGKVVLSGGAAGEAARGLILGDGSSTTHRVQNLVVRGFGSDGVFGRGVSFGLFSGLEIHSNGGHGLALVPGASPEAGTINPRENAIGTTSFAGGENFIYANGGDGVLIVAAGVAGAPADPLANQVTHNFIGLRDGDAGGDFGNRGHGVRLVGGGGNLVGSLVATGPANVIGGNHGDGVRVEGAGAVWNRIRYNAIGTTASRALPLGNRGSGVALVAGAGAPAGSAIEPNSVVGNVIAANGVGVWVDGAGTDRNAIEDNSIGTNAGRATGLGNLGAGVLISGGARGTAVGYPGPNPNRGRNVIVGNGGPGVDVAGAGTTGTQIVRNWIGSADGATAAPNTVGVRFRDGAGANPATESPFSAIYANLVSGNNGPGVELAGAGEGVSVYENKIGVTPVPNTASARLPNTGDGVLVRGGTRSARVQRNIIGANGGSGVHLRDAGTDGTQIGGNRIGTNDFNPVVIRLGNAGAGLRINGASDTGTNPLGMGSNTIVYNGGAGILIEAGTRNHLDHNGVFANGGPGIDLAPGGATGVTPNDGPGDPDAGPNGLQNAPVLVSLDMDPEAHRFILSGYVATTPNTQIQVRLFTNDTTPEGREPSGYGEGQSAAATLYAITDAAGYARIEASSPLWHPSLVFTAIVDGPEGTSEFSNRVAASRLPVVGSLAAAPDPVRAGEGVTLTARGVTDPDDAVAAVAFYRESNGAPGLQAAREPQPGDDVLVGTDAAGSNGWSLSLSTAGLAPGAYTYYARGVDEGGHIGTAASANSTVAPAAAAVVGRHVFYNNSAFDGGDAAAGASDDAAVALDKSAILPGAAPSFAGVTSYDKGINGVMVDVAGLPAGATLTRDDFDFGNAAPAEHVTVRRGAGAGGSDRVTLTWVDFSLFARSPYLATANGWLTVTVKANERTGLAAPDVFTFGHLTGEAGDEAAAPFRVSALDLAAVKQALFRPASVTAPTDFNRDGKTNALDVAVVKRQFSQTLAPPAASLAREQEPPDRAWTAGLLG